MQELKLFLASDGSWVTTTGLRRQLEEIGATDCKVLYIHTGMTFGVPNPALSRTDLLDHLLAIIASLGVDSLCFPTFTFSFCNGENFDVRNSRSRMGALNEHLRRRPGTLRSVDPLMSNILLGKEAGLVTGLGNDSVGKDSTFDRLHTLGRDVRFLFLGTTASECFTYTHYVEERWGVPYRYNRSFRGLISDGGRSWEDEYRLFVRYRGVVPATDGRLERSLIEQGHLKKQPCGDSSLSCVREPEAHATITEHLQADTHVYIAFDPRDQDQTFEVYRMVAL